MILCEFHLRVSAGEFDRDPPTVFEMLYALRSMGLSIAQIARAINVPQGTVGGWSKGGSATPWPQAKRLYDMHAAALRLIDEQKTRKDLKAKHERLFSG